MIRECVSVVIPTCKNKPGGNNPIDKCLESIALSTYKNIEIICVEEGLERAAQRNHGIKDAHGEYILYLDDDQYISPNLIAECVVMMQRCDAIYIPEIIVTRNWFDMLRNWERKFYTGTAVDCVRFFRKEGCPAFDESLKGPEDADFDHRVEGRKLVSKNPLYHDDNITLAMYLKKKAYYAQSMEYYKKKWPNDKVLNPLYRCFGIFIEDGKWKILARRPHYALMMFALIFLRGVIYICRKR